MPTDAALFAGAVDCHAHLFGPNHLFPLAAERFYTPDEADETAARRMLARLGLGRIVLVQASVYGADHARLEQGLWRLGAAARGVAAEIRDLSASDLRRLERLGVRGARLNALGRAGDGDLTAALRRQSRRAAEMGWHLQAHLRDDGLLAALSLAPELPCDLVIDHFGYCPGAAPEESEIGRALLTALGRGRCWIKLSASYRLGPDGRDRAARLTERLLRANPERLLWGSDWPHTPRNRNPAEAPARQPFRDVDTRALLADFLSAATRDDDRRRVLVDNPRRLYRFDSA